MRRFTSDDSDNLPTIERMPRIRWQGPPKRRDNAKRNTLRAHRGNHRPGKES